jgi:hypothetical protein
MSTPSKSNNTPRHSTRIMSDDNSVHFELDSDVASVSAIQQLR